MLYRTVTACSAYPKNVADALDKEVQRLLDAGWRLLDGPNVVALGEKTLVMQALIFDDASKAQSPQQCG